MKPLTKEWVDKAEGDYRVASREWQTQDPVCDAVCYHAQQCAEKYLKAWLVENGVSFPRTHDLAQLAKLTALADLYPLQNDLQLLTSAATESRYPGTAADREDAEDCFSALQRIRNLFRKRLAL